MNAPVRLVQVSTAEGTKVVKVVKIEKPAGGTAVTVELSYDQSVRLDLSAIANERIIIVRVGERAIILFDNGATVTLDPFFDSLRRPLANLEFEFGPNKIFSAEEIANLVPFSDDQSILPAAGEGGEPREAGANFSNPNVDPIGPVVLNLLLPPEELPLVEIGANRNALLLEDLIPTQTGAVVTGLVEEEHLVLGETGSPEQLSTGNEDGDGPDNGDADGPGGGNNTTHRISGNAGNGQSLQNLVTGGDGEIQFSLIPTVTGQAVAGVFSKGQQVFFHVFDGTHLIGYTDGNGNGFDGAINPGTSSYPSGTFDRIVFELELSSTGDWTFTIFDQFDHTFGDGIEGLLGINLTSVILGTDANGSEIPFTGNAFVIQVIDDIPIASGEPVIRTINEDDIRTPWSQGTSPNTGGDPLTESTTENNAGPIDPAFIRGSLAGLVSIGSDELPEGTPMFRFAENAEDYMLALNLFSKQVVEPASNNGIALVYSAGPILPIPTGSC